MNKSIMVISAHPDDEVLGLGGTIIKKSRSRHTVSVVFLATGISARYKDPVSKKSKIDAEIKALKKAAEKAGGILGIKKTYFLDFPDNRLDTIPMMDITHAIKDIVNIVKPEIVYTHHFGDYNWDHRIAFEATMMACRANVGDFFPKEIYSYEVLSSTERAFQGNSDIFRPDVFENIKNTVKLKKKALQCYKSELRRYPHPRSPKAVEYLARKRGGEVGLEFAEAFQLIRKINL